MSDNVGSTVQAYLYDSYGNITQVTGVLENPFTYTGRELDSESGLYFYRARYYDPTTGRFLKDDPIGFNGNNINLSGYVDNNPVNFVDPSGLIEFSQEDYIDITVSLGLIVIDIITFPSGEGIGPAAIILGGVVSRQTIKQSSKAISKKCIGKKANNPFGSKGKPDHQKKVKELVKKAKSEKGSGENVFKEKKIQKFPSSRKPDVQIVDKSGKTKKIYEAERRPNGKYNKNREAEYNNLGIDNKTFNLD